MFHLGSARSALQNWIYAQQHQGVFVLRIEDTAAAHNHPEWTEEILSAMDWIGIERGSYEGPYFQSSYAADHAAAATRLYGEGHAYYCDCAPAGTPYDGSCRERALAPGAGRVLRLRTPDEGRTVLEDLVRGEQIVENETLEDFVIADGDGSPLPLLAGVVDDLALGITHLIDTEENLPDAPRQQLLRSALGGTAPVWAHVPVIVNEKREKLSRHRDKVALESYRDEGYLAAAVKNYLMLLGWTPTEEREVVPWQVVEQEYRLEQIDREPAVFDPADLRAFNGDYIRALAPEEFTAVCAPWLMGTDTIPAPPWGRAAFDADLFATLAPLAQARISVLSEIVDYVDFFFLDEPIRDDASWAKVTRDGAAEILGAVAAVCEALDDWSAEALKARFQQLATARDVKLSRIKTPVRVAVTGRSTGMPLFESLEMLGKDVTLRRLRAAVTAD
jgi:glutamyl-tRNA synthetase